MVRIVHQWRCTGGIRVKCIRASWSSGTWSIWVPACSTAMCRTAIREIYSSKLHLHRVQKWIKVILGSFLNRRVREYNLLPRSPPLLCLQYNDQELEMNKASAKTYFYVPLLEWWALAGLPPEGVRCRQTDQRW